jgi:glycolate oxidase iron-sulfur subunit
LVITPTVVKHWDLCLQCRACEVVCPSGVPYGRIMERTRAQVVAQGKAPASWKVARSAFLNSLLPRVGLLRAGGKVIETSQKVGLRKVFRKTVGRINSTMRGLEAQLPSTVRAPFASTAQVFPAVGEKRATVALLAGCIMSAVHGDTMRATVRVLQRNGCEVHVPVGQGCCGALNAHSGGLDEARAMARRNVGVMLRVNPDYIVTASAGCGSTMREYAELLNDDVLHARAEEFSGKTIDVTVLLTRLGVRPPKVSLPLKVTYQDPCHLAHAQRTTIEPREVLKAIPGIELVEMENATRCCGAAGVYMLTNREMSQKLLDRKLGWVKATNAQAVCTANPGCMMQLQGGVVTRGLDMRVCHVVDLLDEAYQQEETPSG